MTLRMLQFFALYLVSSISHFLLSGLCTHLQGLIITTLENLLEQGSIPFVCYDLIFTTLEVGGLGFVPFNDVAQQLRQNLEVHLIPILDSLKIVHNIHPSEPKSIQWIWNHIASTRALSRNSSVLDKSYCSWISAWPNLRIRQFQDSEYKFGLLHCLRWLPSVNTTCYFKQTLFDYRTASAIGSAAIVVVVQLSIIGMKRYLPKQRSPPSHIS